MVCKIKYIRIRVCHASSLFQNNASYEESLFLCFIENIVLIQFYGYKFKVVLENQLYTCT